MNIDPIGATGIQNALHEPRPESPSITSFAETLAQAVRSLDAIQKHAADQAAQLAAGEPVELHDVMIAQEWASVSLELAVQVRNKLVEAYQEIMRMQI